MNKPQDASGTKALSEPPAAGPTFVPPPGWLKSTNTTTSRFAFEISNTTNWYRNDGQGNGYFAPGWDNERIARRAGVFRWIALALAAVILGLGAVQFTLQYGEQTRYTQIKGGGVETIALVGPVTVEHSSSRSRQSSRKYITRTTARISYVVDGRTLHGDITASRSMFRPLGSEVRYPEPAWSTGQHVILYADPVRPEHFVVFQEYKEEDADSIPRGAVFVMIFTGFVLLLPVVLFIAGTRNVREARKL